VARMWKQLISLTLAFVLIATIAPWNTQVNVKAAGDDGFILDGVGDEDDPKPVTSAIMDLGGTFTGIAGDTITYEVVRIVGAVRNPVSKGEKPIITGGTRFLFTGVQLAEGLNEITVSGTSQGGTRKAVGYVLYGNEPMITSIRLADGRVIPDGGELLVSGPLQPVIQVTAKNTTSVTVNGKTAFAGGGESFSAENLGLTQGVNTLTIIAENAGKTYEVSRKIVYFNGTSTVYDLQVGSTVINGSTIDELPSATVSGKIAFELPTGIPAPSAPNVDIWLEDADGDLIGSEIVATVGTTPVKQGNIIIYNFTTAASIPAVTDNGEYAIVVEDNWRGAFTESLVKFKVRDPDMAYINGIKQLKGVTLTGSAVTTVTRSEDYPVDQMMNIPSLPIYLHIESSKDISASVSTSIASYLEGSSTPSALLDVTPLTYNNERVYRINRLPQGRQSLQFTITESSSNDIVTRTAEYVPIPAIRLTNLADGQRFNNIEALNDLAIPGETTVNGIRGQLINFAPADYANFTMTFNGSTKTVNSGAPATFTIDAATGIFTVADDVPLIEGPNILTFRATTNGVPISTTITVYYFSTDIPTIAWINPVRDTDPDQPITKNSPDEFFISEDDGRYSTTEDKVDVLFEIANATKVFVRVDGTVVASADVVAPYTSDNISLTSPDGKNWRFKQPLPETGPRSVTISVVKGTSSFERTIVITRENPKYRILSPRLPKEKLVNQNFLNISIQAPGAVRIELGKQTMKEGLNDIFRLTYTGLKPGTNKIKFTVYQSEDGKTKFDDVIEVTYAGDSSPGAQNRQALGSKMNAFNGDLSLSFPKNTFLQQIKVDGMPNNSTDLFEDQEILFGIADKTDGRTVKTYNVDGTITTINQDALMRSRVAPLSHYLMVSDLYWVDAGYMKLENGDYVSVPAEHPYMNYINGTDYQPFATRVNDKSKWLEPSQRGTITLKYDPELRNVTANNVSVWRLNGVRWENIGGVVDVNRKTVTAPFEAFGYYAVMSLNYSYNDIESHGYGRDSMELLLARGIMNAKDPSEFGAYDNITRGEFAQMLVKMANIELDYDNDVNKLTFIDVPMSDVSGLWDYRYIETAARKGIVRGKTPRLFAPNEPLTREQAAVMIARALNLLKGKEDMEKDRAALQKAFTDANLIVDINSYSSIQAVVKAGFIQGIPNTTSGGAKPTFRFDPRSNLMRGDAAIITVRVMKSAKLL